MAKSVGNLEREFAFVDIETTGSNPMHDRVIEVAVIRVKGGEVVKEWSTLVNPERHIPEFIQGYVGINNEMVEGAPTFDEIADELYELLDGAVFVAHSVSFDYGFLKHSFARCEKVFNQKRMCTVKLSRAMYPGFRKHSLDALIDRHGFECSARHRAMGDTEVLWQFWQHLHGEFEKEEIDKAVGKQLKSAKLPSKLIEDTVKGLEDTPGVYLFYGDSDVPLYIGKSVNLKSRVLSHFSGDHRSYRALKVSQQVKRVETIDTAGDLGARLKESYLIKKMKPLFNRQLRRNHELCSIVLEKDVDGYDRVELVKEADLDVGELGKYFGVFQTTKAAKEFLEEVGKEFELCLEKLGLEKPGAGGCFAHRLLKRCKGACCGKELVVMANARLREVLYKKKLEAWPFDGRVGLREYNAVNGVTELHVFENWCYVGSVGSEEELRDFQETIKDDVVFDLDTYKIVRKFLEKGRVEVVKV